MMVVLSRASPGDQPPPCVRLTPYVHQVGGHVAVLALDSQTICKPHIDKEYQFYQDLPHGLHKFVPEFKGVADVVVQQARDGYLNLVACPYPGGMLRCQSQEDAGPERDHGSRGPAQPTPPLPRSPRAKPVYRVRLSEGGSLSIDQDSDNDDLFEDLSAESGYRRFGCNPWSIHCHRQQISKMRGEPGAHQSHKFLMLENVTNRFRHPCILDLKIGLRSYGDDATEAKKKSHKARVQSTTSAKMGVRVCGMQVYRPDMCRFLCRNKYYGRRLSEEGLRQLVGEFVFDGRGYRVDVIRSIIAEIASLREVLSGLDHYRFYGSSLLLIYEGSSGPEDSPLEESLCHVRQSFASDWNSSSNRRKDETGRALDERLNRCASQNQCMNPDRNDSCCDVNPVADTEGGLPEEDLYGTPPALASDWKGCNHGRKDEVGGAEGGMSGGFMSRNQCMNPEDSCRDPDPTPLPEEGNLNCSPQSWNCSFNRTDSTEAGRTEEDMPNECTYRNHSVNPERNDSCCDSDLAPSSGKKSLHHLPPSPMSCGNSSNHRRKCSCEAEGADDLVSRSRDPEGKDLSRCLNHAPFLVRNDFHHRRKELSNSSEDSEDIGMGMSGVCESKKRQEADDVHHSALAPRPTQNDSRSRREGWNDDDPSADVMKERGLNIGGSTIPSDCRIESGEDRSSHLRGTAMVPDPDLDSVARCESGLNYCRLDAVSPSTPPHELASPTSAWGGEVKRPYDSLNQADQSGSKLQRTTEPSFPAKDIAIGESSDKDTGLPPLPGSSEHVGNVAKCPRPLVHIRMIDFAHSEFQDQTGGGKPYDSEDYVGTTDSGTDSGHALACEGFTETPGAQGTRDAGGYDGPDRDFLYGLENLLDIFRDLCSKNVYEGHREVCCGSMFCED